MTPLQAQPGSRILNAFVAKRQAERRAINVKNVRGYDAAKRDHLTAGWTSSSASANEDIRNALEIVRARSRDLAANNDYMRKFLRMCEVNIVGPHGFRYKNLTANPGARARPTTSKTSDVARRMEPPGSDAPSMPERRAIGIWSGAGVGRGRLPGLAISRTFA